METRSRGGSAKPVSSRKKKSVELYLVKRKALADKNIATIPVVRSSGAACDKENLDQQTVPQQITTAFNDRNSKKRLPKVSSVCSVDVLGEKLQNLSVITEEEDTENTTTTDANVSLHSKDSEASLRKDLKSDENGIPIISFNKRDENVCVLSSRTEQGKNSKRSLGVWEHLESLFYVEDYKKDIVQYLQERERELCLQRAPNCSQFAKLHAVIVNWLTKLLNDLELMNELLFISVTLLDRLLTKLYIPVNKLQLAAMACLWVALKQCRNTNIWAPELIVECKVKASVNELVAMERVLLNRLNFNIIVIEPILFVNYYLSEMKMKEKRIKQISEYLLDVILLNGEYCTMYPSLVGSAAVYAALSVCGKEAIWDTMQEEHREFHHPSQFSHILDAMLIELKAIHSDRAKFRAAYSKHRKNKYGKISKRLIVIENELFLQ